jgi:hypothetical protein
MGNRTTIVMIGFSVVVAFLLVSSSCSKFDQSMPAPTLPINAGSEQGVAPTPKSTTPTGVQIPNPLPSPEFVTGQPGSVYINPRSQFTYSGSQFTVNIEVMPAAWGISAADVQLSFDTENMQIVRIEPGDALGSNPILGMERIDNQAGTVSYALARVGKTASSGYNGVIAKVTFLTAVGITGSFKINITSVGLANDTFEEIGGIELDGATVTVESIKSTVQVKVLPRDFSEVQGVNGFFYESYGDNRPSNTKNRSTAGAQRLSFVGILNLVAGSVSNNGPTYALSGGFPYIIFDKQRNLLLMHPGTGGISGTANLGAALTFVAPSDGKFRFSGSFARANDAKSAGNGVDVTIFKNSDISTPLFVGNISSDHIANANNPFSSTGVTNFNLEVTLMRGDSIHFVVFADSQGDDGTFDLTALRLTVSHE